ncbi:metallophosphoesterase family protein [Loigolactobacillus iwatensis]|uniref:metallophosphoesterase family protein n=1 Tax=Loigolactobacillus iwatensis TaxID=1267156 RepID=UPI000F7E4CD7|nr:metallophosphoesterase [Loigolactobacillus iwatensis]
MADSKVTNKVGASTSKTEESVDDLTTVGFYWVNHHNQTPDGQSYTLYVGENYQHSPFQLLFPAERADRLGGNLLYRSWSRHFQRYNSFVRVADNARVFMAQFMAKFVSQITQVATKNSLTMGVITDTHDRAGKNYQFYGTNGLQHVEELKLLDNFGVFDAIGHLGDLIDGANEPSVSRVRLGQIIGTLNQSKTPFFVTKGNHDENDKYAIHQPKKQVSDAFGPNDFADLVWKKMYAQAQIHEVSARFGVGYFDKGPVRIIFINTSDVPYELTSSGAKRYDTKKMHAIRGGQMQEIVAILQRSLDKNIIFFGHAPLVDAAGHEDIVKNGGALQELCRYFNQHQHGRLVRHSADTLFALNLRYDFSQIGQSKVSAYICGHLHNEGAFVVDDIQYVMLNCSALISANQPNVNQFNQNFDRQQGTLSESAGYAIDVNNLKGRLTVLGYGAATPKRTFTISSVHPTLPAIGDTGILSVASYFSGHQHLNLQIEQAMSGRLICFLSGQLRLPQSNDLQQERVATIPLPYRPKQLLLVPVQSINGDQAQLGIEPNGDVWLTTQRLTTQKGSFILNLSWIR